ncbi:dihydroxyacetone kinase phosphoryl donor subunit DhaM [Sodalis sp. RH16]|uniref:dihydroxyacetone kinase phosphoryl donor subunit DhaM n=1 Tax=Sodalis sp. RH16 TaxID=3394331 RepID=UPI0039B490E8
MVNLVVVSHSAKLAEGVAELAGQMIQGGCRLITAAGVDDEAHPIGTDAVKIMAAIEEVFDPSGVVVMMDLGSALLSAETALELLDPDMARQVRLCAAPLVEGTLAAAVAASNGADLDRVMADAMDALAAKRAQLGETVPAGGEAPPDETATAAGAQATPPGEGARRAFWRIENPHGLHARPAARLVSVLSPFAARLTLEKTGQFADANRLNQVAALQVRQGDEIVLYAEGEQADAALAAFLQEARTGFGETIPTQEGEVLQGTTVAEPPVTARAWRLTGDPRQNAVGIPAMTGNQTQSAQPRADTSLDCIQLEQRRFAEAIDQAQRQLEQLAAAISLRLGPRFAGIFEAQAMLLSDEGLRDAVAENIPRLGSAAAAWRKETAAMAADYAGLQDEYLRVRELDVRDMRDMVLALIDTAPPPPPPPSEEYILIGKELYPSRLASLDRAKVAGIALEGGHPLSHTAILARAMGIPILVGITGLMDRVHNGQTVTLDPARGVLRIA